MMNAKKNRIHNKEKTRKHSRRLKTVAATFCHFLVILVNTEYIDVFALAALTPIHLKKKSKCILEHEQLSIEQKLIPIRINQ